MPKSCQKDKKRSHTESCRRSEMLVKVYVMLCQRNHRSDWDLWPASPVYVTLNGRLKNAFHFLSHQAYWDLFAFSGHSQACLCSHVCHRKAFRAVWFLCWTRKTPCVVFVRYLCERTRKICGLGPLCFQHHGSDREELWYSKQAFCSNYLSCAINHSRVAFNPRGYYDNKSSVVSILPCLTANIHLGRLSALDPQHPRQ